MAAMMLSSKLSSTISAKASARRSVAARAARQAPWFPGSEAPAHLTGKLPADFGFDPLGLGSDPDRLKWFVESELVHCRWSMLAVAGILVQEVVQPDTFWYTAPTTIKLPFPILGLLAVEAWLMHWVESLRVQDFKAVNSVNQDPIFANNKLADHEVGYPGFAPFIPGDLNELKVKEIKNGRLAMLAFVGFTMAAQVTGKGPLAALAEHLAAPFDTTIFSKAVVIPGQAIVPTCAIPSSVVFEGLTIPTPCFLQALWP